MGGVSVVGVDGLGVGVIEVSVEVDGLRGKNLAIPLGNSDALIVFP